MGVREDTVALLRSGLSPREIAEQRGVQLETTLAYLDQMVGSGEITRSDILFSLARDVRRAISTQIKAGRSSTCAAICRRLKAAGMETPREDVAVFLRYGDAAHALGEMYENIRQIEVGLHSLIRCALEQEFGSGELGWWRKGIPVEVRQKCQERREEDKTDVPAVPYGYTDLMDLWKILDAGWSILAKHLPRSVAGDKREVRRALLRLNGVRNAVMHPIRGEPPREDEFEFVRNLKKSLGFGRD